ncbi:hypothetical protein BDW66DRAFT_20154 [Aspergillus desertorum]
MSGRSSFPALVAWSHDQVKMGNPALILKALWKDQMILERLRYGCALQRGLEGAPNFCILDRHCGLGICAGSPLFMDVVHPPRHWVNAFASQALQTISFDALYTASQIVIADSFAKDTQASAAAVPDAALQFGHAVGLVVLQVISTVVLDESADRNGERNRY